MTDTTEKMPPHLPADPGKRTWLIASSCVGAVGVAAAASPFVISMMPSERAKAAGAPVEFDIAQLSESDPLRTVEWRGKPVWILRRTEQEVADLSKVDDRLLDPDSLRRPEEFTPEYARNKYRSIKPEILVVVGICTHLGCSPTPKLAPGPQPSLPADWPGGFFCPCHGSMFDLAGRVFKNMPAPDNLIVPPHMYLSETRLLIGEDKA